MILKLLKHKTISKCYRLKKLFFSQLSPINEYLYDAKQIRFFVYNCLIVVFYSLFYCVSVYICCFYNFFAIEAMIRVLSWLSTSRLDRFYSKSS